MNKKQVQLILPIPEINTLTIRERPDSKIEYDPDTCNSTDLLSVLIGGERQIETAKKIIFTYGLPGLQQLSVSELSRIDGIGKIKAKKIKAAFVLAKRVAQPENYNIAINGPEPLYESIKADFIGLDHEIFVVVCMNTKNKIIKKEVLYKGSLNCATIRIGEVFKSAIILRAGNIAIAHNHPSGDLIASSEDITLTRCVIQAGKLLDIPLLDHLIIGNGSYISLKEKGLGF